MKKLMGYARLGLSFLFFLILILEKDPNGQLKAQGDPAFGPVRVYQASAYTRDSLEQLVAKYGRRKVIPEAFKLQILLALRHYPELANVPITFTVQDAKGSLTSQPVFRSVINPFQERSYRVIIDTVKQEERAWTENTLLGRIPFNGQVGILGHELAHTVSYLDQRGVALAWTGIRYGLSKKFVRKFENATDLRTIDHGLGYQLLAWSRFTHATKTREGKGEVYLSPERIEEVLQMHPAY